VQRRKRPNHLARIRVVGIGSGGRTAVDGLIAAGVMGVDFLVIDTDSEALRRSRAPLLIHIGKATEVRRGTGGNSRQGREIAQKAIDVIDNAMHGSDLVFIVAGLGGGTGTGAAPIVAQVASNNKALVIGIVTYPFTFEGEQRAATAREGIAHLRKESDTLLVVPNDRLLELGKGAIGFHETYRLAGEIWYQSIQGISELLNQSGLINVDFADLRTIMSQGDAAIIAVGRGQGAHRARRAAEQALHSKLLGIAVDGARGILFNITGGPDMTLLEVEEAAATITGRVHADANVIFGAAIDDALGSEMRITVIATGFGFTSPGHRHSLRTPTIPWQPKPIPLHPVSD
jgi:cell division protein FtsZ